MAEVTEGIEEVKHWTIFRVRVSAIIETIIFLTILLFFDYILGERKHFTDVNPHPFWIVVLVISVQYGTAEGVIAVFLCTIALYAGYIPEIKFDETLFDYRVRLALTPTLWLIAAVVLGEMRMRIDNERKKYKEMAIDAQNEAEKIADNYTDLKEKKERIEVRLASQMRSIAFTYRALRHLESMNPAQILLSMTDMVKEILDPRKFSIYSFSSAGFEAMVCKGWDKEDKYLRRFPSEHPLCLTIAARKRVVCVINEEDEAVLSGEGYLATPILDADSGEIYGMLKIEEIDFTELNISNLELTETLAELVGTAFSNAQKYTRLKRHSIYASTEEAAYSYFLYQLNKELLAKILSKAGRTLMEIDVVVETKTRRPDKDFLSLRPSLIQILKRPLSHLDTLYQMGRDELHYAILLPLASADDAEKIKRDIEKQAGQNPYLSDKKVAIKITSSGKGAAENA